MLSETSCVLMYIDGAKSSVSVIFPERELYSVYKRASSCFSLLPHHGVGFQPLPPPGYVALDENI